MKKKTYIIEIKIYCLLLFFINNLVSIEVLNDELWNFVFIILFHNHVSSIFCPFHTLYKS